MNIKTNTEVLAIFKAIWPDAEEVKVEYNQNGEYRVRVANMYSAPVLAFRQIGELSKIFGTLEIDTGESIAEGGCETCDYGSAYGFTIHIKPEPALA